MNFSKTFQRQKKYNTYRHTQRQDVNNLLAFVLTDICGKDMKSSIFKYLPFSPPPRLFFK